MYYVQIILKQQQFLNKPWFAEFKIILSSVDILHKIKKLLSNSSSFKIQNKSLLIILSFIVKTSNFNVIQN